MINAVGREIPNKLLEMLKCKPFQGAFINKGKEWRKQVYSRTVYPGSSKVLSNLRESIEASNLSNGMTISFHHHLRNGDKTIQLVLTEIEKAGIRDLTLAASGLFECHGFIVDFIKRGVVSKIQTNYLTGRLAKFVDEGNLPEPVIMRSHGGRDRAIESGDLEVDVAFLAAPTADTYGNLNGLQGRSAFGSFGYAFSDARYANCVVAITDNLCPYPLEYISIDQTLIDYVVEVESIGDSNGIVSGTTKITRDPLGLLIGDKVAEVIESSGYLRDGFSLQTGAGGISLAAAESIRKSMGKLNIQGGFCVGGITKPLVDMLEQGLFRVLLDTQCFDLEAVRSLERNFNHREVSSSVYSNPHTKGAIVNQLDVVILGASEIDLNFNVNVTTDFNGSIIGGSGGHADTAAGSNLCIIVCKLNRGRIPSIVEQVTTVNTPGETVDVLVTDRGIAINPRREELREKLLKNRVVLKEIQELKETAEQLCGKAEPIEFSDKIIGVLEYRDGTIIDIIRKPLDIEDIYTL